MERLKLKPSIELCLLVIAVAGVALIFVKPISAWTASLWIIDYPDEFIKRGLLGSVLQFLAPSYFTSISGINILCHSILLLLTVLLTVYFAKAFLGQRLFTTALLVSGFSIQQFIFDAGRFDQVNFVLSFLALFLIQLVNKPLFVTFFASLISITMLLIHEAAIFINIPLVFIALYFKQEAYSQAKHLLIGYSLACLVVMLLIALNGMLNTTSYSQWLISINAKPIDFVIDENAMQFLDNTLLTNIQLTLDRLFDKKTLSRIVRLLLLSVPTFFVMRSVFISVKSFIGNKAYLLFLPVVSVLPLFLLGIDFYRWLAILQLNFFVALAIFCLASPSIREALAVNKPTLALMIVFGLYTGPFGISVAMPERLMLLSFGG